MESGWEMEGARGSDGGGICRGGLMSRNKNSQLYKLPARKGAKY